MLDDSSKFEYPAPETHWKQLEFPSTGLTALTLGLLTTLISYQLTAAITDLVLGWKPRNIARVHTFQSLLLSRKGSPIAVLNAIFRTDFLTRFHFHGNLPARAVIARDHDRVRLNAVFLLLALLFTAPLANILAVIMIIENDTTLTFSQARFPNVSFGIWNGERPKVQHERYSDACAIIPVDYLPQDTGLSKFHLCKKIFGPKPWNENSSTRRGSVSMTSVLNLSLKIQIRVGSMFMDGYINGFLKAPEKNFRMRIQVTRDDAKYMSTKAIEMIKEACGDDQPQSDLQSVEEGINLGTNEVFLYGIKGVACPVKANSAAVNEVDVMVAILQNLSDEFVELRNAASFDITPSGSASGSVGEFLDGSKKPFVTRRSRLVGIPVMAILAVTVVVARLTVSVFFNNDVNDGIERILKERVGVPHCASLLEHEETVLSYNTPREDDEGSKLNPMKSYGAWSSFLPSLPSKEPSASQHTLVMFDGLPFGSTDWNRSSQEISMDVDEFSFKGIEQYSMPATDSASDTV